MHIVNVMFGKKRGGIEQSFVDYCAALLRHNHKVTALICPDARIKEDLLKLDVNVVGVKNLGQWDVFAKLYIRKILKQTQPEAIILHGNRAIKLVKPVAGDTQLIGVTHNYNVKNLLGLDAIFATTKHLKQTVMDAGYEEKKIHMVPNMVTIPDRPLKPKPFKQPVVVGAMGRFVKKKGFDVFIEAISILDKKEVKVKAILGGDGEEKKSLKKLAEKLGLEYKVRFPGWIKDKEEFFEKIDIFCLPSHHEPFGIILLEAFSYAKPVVTTDSEGPSEIAKHNSSALVVPKNDAKAMANAISQLASNQPNAHAISRYARHKSEQYTIDAVSIKISKALHRIVPLQL